MKKLLSTLTVIALAFAAHIQAAAPGDTAVMNGVPPSRESQVTFKNYRHYPFNKWAFHNSSAPFNMLTIPRQGEVSLLVQKNRTELGRLELTDGFGETLTVDQVLINNDTDGFVVLRDDEILFERYYGDMNRHDHHIWFSATKSLVSTALGILVEEGKIKLSDSPAKYISELKGSGFERTTIQNVLNHSSAIDFKENYTDESSDFLKYYGPALNLAYIPGGRDAQPGKTDIYGVHDFLEKFIGEDKTLQPGDEFDYNSANADVAGWLVARVSGVPLHDFLQEKIWSKLGAEHDALIAVDRAYMPVATGGMSTTLRDAARFGQMILNQGRVNEEQVIPANWVDQSLRISANDKLKMKRNSNYQENAWIAYKNMWWIIDDEQGEYAAVGIHGQVIYINRSANVVIAYFSSQPVASSSRNPQFQSKLFAAQKIARHLQIE
jgi:CubicO group peptidase (beta-lactamase class C family)